MLDADLVQEQVDPPCDHWCASGHKAPLLFRRDGPNSLEEPTRFYSVKGHGINGIYCELCLIVAHHMGMLKKQGLLSKE
jgi:predicted amino acid dehydrogenase